MGSSEDFALESPHSLKLQNQILFAGRKSAQRVPQALQLNLQLTPQVNCLGAVLGNRFGDSRCRSP